VKEIKKNVFVLTANLLAVLFLFLSANADAAGRQQLKGHLLKVLETAPLVGDLNPNEVITLSISLPLRHRNQLDQFNKNVSDPSNALYRQYLSLEQFTETYGPLDKDYQSLIDFTTSNGFTIVATYPNRALLTIQGTVAQIEKAFYTKLHRYKRADGTSFRAPDREPSLDLNTTISHISGLDDYLKPKNGLKPLPADVVKKQSSKQANPLAGSAIYGSYIGNDFRNLYASCTTIKGSGQSVALLEFDTYYPADISSYASYAGIPLSTVIPKPVDGFSASPNVDNGEVALDIEMVMSMAPSAKILVYELGGT